MRTAGRRLVSWLLGCVLVLVVADAFAQSIDPQSLVGEWSGRWQYHAGARHPRGGQTSGKYYLTITKVEGDKVYGTGHNPDRKPPDFNFVGTLEGNVLRFGPETARSELTIERNTMQGVRRGGPVLFDLTLQKQK